MMFDPPEHVLSDERVVRADLEEHVARVDIGWTITEQLPRRGYQIRRSIGCANTELVEPCRTEADSNRQVCAVVVRVKAQFAVSAGGWSGGPNGSSLLVSSA